MLFLFYLIFLRGRIHPYPKACGKESSGLDKLGIVQIPERKRDRGQREEISIFMHGYIPLISLKKSFYGAKKKKNHDLAYRRINLRMGCIAGGSLISCRSHSDLMSDFPRESNH